MKQDNQKSKIMKIPFLMKTTDGGWNVDTDYLWNKKSCFNIEINEVCDRCYNVDFKPAF